MPAGGSGRSRVRVRAGASLPPRTHADARTQLGARGLACLLRATDTF